MAHFEKSKHNSKDVTVVNRSVLMHQELQWSYFVHCCLMKRIKCANWKEDQVTKEEYVI